MRILLDTNVWSRIADHKERDALHHLVRKTSTEIVVSPASLLEVLSGQRRQSRQARINLMAQQRWTRLPTEARVEAEELISEIQRLRPEWAQSEEPSSAYRSHERFWAQEIWERARRGEFERPPAVHETQRSEEEAITSAQRSMQQEFRGGGEAQSVEHLAKWLSRITALPDETDRNAVADGWILGRPSEPWRYESFGTLWHAISTVNGDNTYLDWLEPYLDINGIREQRREFGHLLLYEVSAQGMVWNWLRWAVRFMQISARIQLSNPRDEQLASYMPDADLFCTTDKTFFRILQATESSAPSTFATPCLLRGSPTISIVDQISDALVDMSGSLHGPT